MSELQEADLTEDFCASWSAFTVEERLAEAIRRETESFKPSRCYLRIRRP